MEMADKDVAAIVSIYYFMLLLNIKVASTNY